MGGCCSSNHEYIENETPFYKICISNPTGDIKTFENKAFNIDITKEIPELSEMTKLEKNLPFSQRDINTVINNKNVILNLWERQDESTELDIVDCSPDDLEVQKRYAKYFYYNCDIYVLTVSYVVDQYESLDTLYN